MNRMQAYDIDNIFDGYLCNNYDYAICKRGWFNSIMSIVVKWAFQVYTYFLNFDPKHRLWVLVSKAVLTCTHNQCCDQNFKNIKLFIFFH